MSDQRGAFEIEAGTLARFLELLQSREKEGVPQAHETLPRRAVFVVPIRESRADDTGIPIVTRRIRAAFAYGPDLVALTRLTSHDYEFPEPADDGKNKNARQEEALEALKGRIEVGMGQLGISLPVIVAWLKLPGHSAEIR